MSEIEKMYKNAGVEPIAEYCKHQCNNEFDDNACIGCKHIEKVEYPPFTAEKHLLLENFLLEDSKYKTFTQFEMLKTIENKFLYVYRFSKNNSNLKRFDTIGETRQECLAGLINNLWQDLTEEEKQQVKGILE